MASAPLPADEPARLKALRDIRVLDTPPEEGFDRITRMARDLLGVSVAQVTLIDAEREWVKSAAGGPREEIPRSASFCAWSIIERDTVAVEDCRADRRFADDPTVTCADGIRLYAAAQLRTDGGFALGSLCVMDPQPRRLDERERRLLENLARLVMDQLALRLARDRVLEELVERRAVEAELRRREGQLLEAQRVARLGDWRWQPGSDQFEMSPETARILALDAGRRPALAAVLARVAKDDRARVAAALHAVRDGATHGSIEFRIDGGRGSQRHVRAEICREIGADVRAMVLSGVIQDVSERKAFEERITHLALHDPLTDLPNRRRFEERVTALLSRRAPFALSLIDLDHFKEINDGAGHAAGDALLREVADRLRHAAGASDFVTRLGGDEFAILAPGADDVRTVLEQAEVLVARLSVPFTFERRRHPVGASIGVALFPDHAMTAQQLLRTTDVALYTVKRRGGGGAAMAAAPEDGRRARLGHRGVDAANRGRHGAGPARDVEPVPAMP